MSLLLNHRRHLLTALHDTVMAGISFMLAIYLRFAGESTIPDLSQYFRVTLLCMLVCLLVFSRMRLYRGLWRYASIPDLMAITKSATMALLVFYLIIFGWNRLEGIPRSVPFIQWLLLLALLGAPRFLYRMLRDHQLGMSNGLAGEGRIPVLLIGSGDRAELFLRDTNRGASSQYWVAGILDDNPDKVGHTIHDVRIYGGADELPEVLAILARKGIRPMRAILTYDTLDGAKVRKLLDHADKLGLPLARLPRLSEFKQGMDDKVHIQPIAVEDLLGRAQNVHDKTKVAAFVKGKRVLVTGAGGTIGSELVRQVAALEPSEIMLWELSEYALYQIDLELSRDFPTLKRQAIIGDVRNTVHLDTVFSSHKPEIVFHAAAIKHVPLAEDNAEEAVLTNVFGTQRVADACVKAGVLVMLFISTDKAVNPTNIMGASKRAAESYCQALGQDDSARGSTRFVAVRFGNVLGSTGSVVPLFQQQLAKGGPLTVTHKDVVRFFMTVREAVELVLQAATLGNANAEVYVLDMGEQVKIIDLAEQMIRLAGLKPYKDIQIEFTGLRPGEKMFEELFHISEEHAKTTHESIWLAGGRTLPMAELKAAMQVLYDACIQRRSAEVGPLLKNIVPEYQHS